MYALIETGGKQYKVSPGTTLVVERLDAEPGTEVKIDKVLALVKEDGTVFGAPYVANASVSAEVVENGKAKKVLVFKMKPRKDHRKLNGHRQQFTRLKVRDIQGG